MDTYQTRMAPQFRALLLERARQLGASLDHEFAAIRGGVERGVADFKDVAADQSAADVESVQADQAAAELSNVRDALGRLENGTYGNCQACGEAIDLQRLLVVPVTPYCTACQRIQERHHG